MLDKWKTEQATATAINKSVRTLRKWRQRGIGPPYTYFGKTIKYHEDRLADYYNQGEITPVRNKQRAG
jgi:hypothetical protein